MTKTHFASDSTTDDNTRYTDIATYRLNHPRGCVSENATSFCSTKTKTLNVIDFQGNLLFHGQLCGTVCMTWQGCRMYGVKAEEETDIVAVRWQQGWVDRVKPAPRDHLSWVRECRNILTMFSVLELVKNIFWR